MSGCQGSFFGVRRLQITRNIFLTACLREQKRGLRWERVWQADPNSDNFSEKMDKIVKEDYNRSIKQ